MGAHVYRYQTYPDAGGQCPTYKKDAQLHGITEQEYSLIESETKKKNIIKNMKTGETEKFTLTHGSGWHLDIDMSAGEEIEFLIEFNWQRRGITKDWALTAWGEKGEVSIRHS